MTGHNCLPIKTICMVLYDSIQLYSLNKSYTLIFFFDESDLQFKCSFIFKLFVKLKIILLRAYMYQQIRSLYVIQKNKCAQTKFGMHILIALFVILYAYCTINDN